MGQRTGVSQMVLIVFLAMSIIAWTRSGVQWNWAGEHLTGSARLSAMSTVMTAIGVGWGVTWFAYASDYSRFVRRGISRQIDRRKLTYGVGVLAMIFTIFLVYQQNFANTLDAWLSGMVTWVAPWAAVMLIHYWIFTRQRIDVDELFEPVGRGPLADVRWSAVIAFAAGILVTWVFSYGAAPFLQGPAVRAIGGVDLSWLAGAVVACLVYYLTGARSASEPAPVATPVVEAL